MCFFIFGCLRQRLKSISSYFILAQLGTFDKIQVLFCRFQLDLKLCISKKFADDIDAHGKKTTLSSQSLQLFSWISHVYNFKISDSHIEKN